MYATVLIDTEQRPTYKIEYEPKKKTIKILSKKGSTKECDKEAVSNSTKKLIEKGIKDKSKKTIIKFTCYLN